MLNPEYTMTDAKIGIPYQFRVKAENAEGVSEPSDASDAVTIYGKVKQVSVVSDCYQKIGEFFLKDNLDCVSAFTVSYLG